MSPLIIDNLLGGVVFLVILVGVWKRVRATARNRRSNAYVKLEPYARNVKVYLQMLAGVGLTGLILLKLLHHFIPTLETPFLLAYVYKQPTLTIVGLALAYSSALELAYTLFTEGPDEAIEPLITGLAAAILLGVSKIEISNLGGVLAIAFAVATLGGLFTIRYFVFIKGSTPQAIEEYVTLPDPQAKRGKTVSPVVQEPGGDAPAPSPQQRRERRKGV